MSKLRKAVIAARYDQAGEIVEAIRVTQPNVAAALRHRVDLFDYEGLRDLLSPWDEEKNDP